MAKKDRYLFRRKLVSSRGMMRVRMEAVNEAISRISAACVKSRGSKR